MIIMPARGADVGAYVHNPRLGQVESLYVHTGECADLRCEPLFLFSTLPARVRLRASPMGSTPEDEPIDGQYDHGSHNRYREASKVEPEVQHLRPGQEPVEEPSHEGTHHPEEHGDYAPAGVAAGISSLAIIPAISPKPIQLSIPTAMPLHYVLAHLRLLRSTALGLYYGGSRCC